MSDALKPLIGTSAERPLTPEEAKAAFTILFDGEATPAQIGGLLMALRTRGETVDEYAAAAAVMRAKCHAVTAPKGAMDIVGTGGDGKGTLNISTAAAFVVAGAGVTVAKHGNRNLSSKSGSADALGQMGIQTMGRRRGGGARVARGWDRLHDGADASPGDGPCRPPRARNWARARFSTSSGR